MFSEEQIAILKQELDSICQRIFAYFDKVDVKAPWQESGFMPHDFNINEWYLEIIHEQDQREAEILSQNISRVVKNLTLAAKSSPLVDDADIRDMRMCLKKIRSALFFREYRFWDSDVIHDEGTVLGVSPATQSDNEPANSAQALKIARTSYNKIIKIVELVSPTESSFYPVAIDREVQGLRKFRPNTAFIMMQIDRNQPDLDDVRDGIKETFASFGIKAVRADEIEHEDMITKRILDEISTSEFLIADLTGARPSVYYEVGYAHAIGKRVILYRKEGTRLHFDLSVHNCPEYKNVGDLKEKLKNRMKSLTNKEPQN